MPEAASRITPGPHGAKHNGDYVHRSYACRPRARCGANRFRPVSGPRGVDFDRLLELLIEHQVLFFRTNRSRAGADPLCRHFGSLHVHPIYPVTARAARDHGDRHSHRLPAGQRQLAHRCDFSQTPRSRESLRPNDCRASAETRSGRAAPRPTRHSPSRCGAC